MTKINARRYPCPGCKKTLIWRYAPYSAKKQIGTFSYGATKNRCRKCARKDRVKIARVDERKRRTERNKNHAGID